MQGWDDFFVCFALLYLSNHREHLHKHHYNLLMWLTSTQDWALKKNSEKKMWLWNRKLLLKERETLFHGKSVMYPVRVSWGLSLKRGQAHEELVRNAGHANFWIITCSTCRTDAHCVYSVLFGCSWCHQQRLRPPLAQTHTPQEHSISVQLPRLMQCIIYSGLLSLFCLVLHDNEASSTSVKTWTVFLALKALV